MYTSIKCTHNSLNDACKRFFFFFNVPFYGKGNGLFNILIINSDCNYHSIKAGRMHTEGFSFFVFPP